MALSSLNIPASPSTVKISIINSTSLIQGIPMSIFAEPDIKGHEFIDCPAYSFLIEHPSNGQKVLFDLGVRKDVENFSPAITKRLKDGGWKVTVEKGVADILMDGGLDAKEINAIIWRSCHSSLL